MKDPVDVLDGFRGKVHFALEAVIERLYLGGIEGYQLDFTEGGDYVGTGSALIGGEGEGTSQRTASIGTATGLNRNEDYIDGSSVSSNGEIITVETYTKMLQEYGQTQLDQTAYTQSFSGNIDSEGLFKLNQDYFLGDIVQIENEKGIKATPRIVEIIYAIDESGTSVVPTFSKWEVNN